MTPPDDHAPVDAALSLDDLTPESRDRIVRFIVSSTLERGLAPAAVGELYGELVEDDRAQRYLDERTARRQMPPGWRDVEDRVLDLETAAHERGVDLAAAWRRASGVALPSGDPMEQLARLAGMPADAAGPRQRSIFDDPDDLEAPEEDESARHEPLEERLPELTDLAGQAQTRIRRFAIEEQLEHGLPPLELLELYRVLETAGDDRARQYLDRVFVERRPPPDWLDLQAEARRVRDLADRIGRDAGRDFADVLRSSPGIEPRLALRMVAERLPSRGG